MPVNIAKGNSAQFVIEFLDANGNLTVPAGGSVTITYPVGLTTQSTTISLTQQNSFFTATWGTSVSDYGNAPWSVTATGSSLVAASGVIRVIDP